MGFVDKAKDAAKKATDAAQKGANEAKDKAHDYNLKRHVSGLAEELGHLVVRQRDGEAGLDAEIDRLVSEIRAAQAEIEGNHDD